jgi:7,8-dihydroneopterin aldolase/epimerase/oxygenase
MTDERDQNETPEDALTPEEEEGMDSGELQEFSDAELEEERLEEPPVTVEITGLSLYTRHGTSPAERELGQRLVLDVSFELMECDATLTDRIEDTVDYADACEQIALAAQERSYRTLERLCSAVAERLTERFGAEAVRVKAKKPEPPIALPVGEVSVEVWKEA